MKKADVIRAVLADNPEGEPKELAWPNFRPALVVMATLLACLLG
jgi:hypothetical protein